MISNALIGLAAGIVLGYAFFGLLWWTTQKGLASPSPVAWFISSFCIRMSCLLLGVYLVAKLGLVCLVSAFVGCMGMRFIVTSYVKRSCHEFKS